MATSNQNASAAQEPSRSNWVFQFIPGEGNEQIESGGAGTRVDWRLTAYKDAVRSGDIIFFWRASGPRSALIGWGEVTGNPFVDASDEKITRIQVTTRALFDSPIAKEELEDQPVLATVGVFSGRQGTNFRLSIEQAAALVEMMRSRGLVHPEVDREALSANLRARIERGVGDLARIAENLPDPDVRGQLLSAIQSVSADPGALKTGDRGIGDKIRVVANQIVALQRAGKWASSANVDTIALQVAEDVERLQSLGGSVMTPGPGTVTIHSAPAGTETDTPPVSGTQPPATPPAPAPIPPPAPPLVAPTDHWYRPWEKEDLVGIKQPVSNLARYISHQELVPPRAIGIFGDWGSGKSFFLRALRSDIALYADQSRTARKNGQRTVFCGHVVQIEFNAWHYVESNLWASIAGYVFEQLYSELQQSTQAHTEETELNTLYKSLDLYKEAVAEREKLEIQAEALTKKRAEVQEEATRKRFNRDQLARGLHVAAKQAAQKAFDGIPQSQKQALVRAAAATQISTAEQASAEANHVLEEGRSTFGRARLATQTWGVTGFVAAAALVLLALLGVPILVGLTMQKFLPAVQPWIATLGSYVALGSAGLSWLSSKASTPLRIASSVLDILSDAEEEARTEERAKLDVLNVELQALEKNIATADAQISEQQHLIAEARDAIDPRNLGTKLKRFLEERARSKGYEEHLGLITLVRRDFETLSNLMRAHWTQRFEKVPQAVIQADGAIGSRKETVPFIERIVLYIDDLDRCPPQKVVEVLQAVHLMLGFPLFVVVVAVDVRWIRESLLKYYPDLLSNAALPSGHGQASPSNLRAQADDYLEKIFQIPFRIPSLNGEATRKLLEGLLKEPFLTATGPGQTLSSIPTLDLTPKELTLYPTEEHAIKALNRSIGVSPRRVRRFLDQYLIMRAGMEDGIVELITKVTNQYQAILGLFAMLSGAPNAAPLILQNLHTELSASTGDSPIATGLSDWLTKNSGPAKQTEAYELEALTQAVQYMDLAQPDRTKLAAALVQWIPEVARYSFREIRLAT